jgi:hypothetical protein
VGIRDVLTPDGPLAMGRCGDSDGKGEQGKWSEKCGEWLGLFFFFGLEIGTKREERRDAKVKLKGLTGDGGGGLTEVTAGPCLWMIMMCRGSERQ